MREVLESVLGGRGCGGEVWRNVGVGLHRCGGRSAEVWKSVLGCG